MNNSEFKNAQKEAIEIVKKIGIGGGFVEYLHREHNTDFRLKRILQAKKQLTNLPLASLFLIYSRRFYNELPYEIKNGFDVMFATNVMDKKRDKADIMFETESHNYNSWKLRSINKLLLSNQLLCGICCDHEEEQKASFKTVQSLVDHTISRHGVIDLYGCHFCSFCFTSIDELKSHDCSEYALFIISSSKFVKNYKTTMQYGKIFFICSDCGRHHIVKMSLTEEESKKQLESLIEFYKYHSPEKLNVVIIWSEKKIKNHVYLRYKTSLNADICTSCEMCKIERFKSIVDRDNHFAEKHQNLMKKCPQKECSVTFINEFKMKEHILNNHIQNGLLANFMSFQASCRLKTGVLIKATKIFNKKEITEKSICVGGFRHVDKMPVLPLPPKKLLGKQTNQENLVSASEELVKKLNINVNTMRLDFKLNDANAKISKVAYLGGGKTEKISDIKVMSSLIDNENQSIVADEAIIKSYFVELELWNDTDLSLEGSEIRGKFIRDVVSFCSKCNTILNGSGVIHNHSDVCGKDVELLKLCEFKNARNPRICCPNCSITLCSINGVIFHMFSVHQTFIEYDSDGTTVTPPTLDKFCETEKINILIGLKANGELKKEINQAGSESTEKNKVIIKKENEEVPELTNEIVTNSSCDVATTSVEKRSNGHRNQEEEFKNNSESMRSRSESVHSPHLEDVNNVTNNQCSNLFSVLNSQQSAQFHENFKLNEFKTSQHRIREETHEPITNVENSHVNEDGDDDIDIINEIMAQKKNIESRDTTLPILNLKEISHNGIVDDECMAVAEAETRNRGEITTSKRSANLQCPKCSKKFITKRSLSDHVSRDHSKDFNDLYEEDYGIPLNQIVWLCIQCSTSFQSSKKFQNHYRRHTENPDSVNIMCKYCSGTSSNVSNLETHFKKHLTMKFICSMCNPMEVFKTESKLMYHLEKEHGTQILYFCKNCVMATTNFDMNFYRHLQFCFQSTVKDPVEMVGCVTASTVTYQPENLDEYKQLLKTSPAQFAHPTLCSHRTMIRFGESFATCFETTNGVPCFSFINTHALEAKTAHFNWHTKQNEVRSGEDVSLIHSLFQKFKKEAHKQEKNRKRKQDTTTQSNFLVNCSPQVKLSPLQSLLHTQESQNMPRPQHLIYPRESQNRPTLHLMRESAPNPVQNAIQIRQPQQQQQPQQQPQQNQQEFNNINNLTLNMFPTQQVSNFEVSQFQTPMLPQISPQNVIHRGHLLNPQNVWQPNANFQQNTLLQQHNSTYLPQPQFHPQNLQQRIGQQQWPKLQPQQELLAQQQHWQRQQQQQQQRLLQLQQQHQRVQLEPPQPQHHPGQLEHQRVQLQQPQHPPNQQQHQQSQQLQLKRPQIHQQAQLQQSQPQPQHHPNQQEHQQHQQSQQLQLKLPQNHQRVQLQHPEPQHHPDQQERQQHQLVQLQVPQLQHPLEQQPHRQSQQLNLKRPHNHQRVQQQPQPQPQPQPQNHADQQEHQRQNHQQEQEHQIQLNQSQNHLHEKEQHQQPPQQQQPQQQQPQPQQPQQKQLHQNQPNSLSVVDESTSNSINNTINADTDDQKIKNSHQYMMKLLSICPSLLCIYCGEERKEMLIRIHRNMMNELIEKIEASLIKETNESCLKTVQKVKRVLLQRFEAAKLTDKYFSICRSHFGSEINEKSELPSNAMPIGLSKAFCWTSPSKQLQPPLLNQLIMNEGQLQSAPNSCKKEDTQQIISKKIVECSMCKLKNDVLMLDSSFMVQIKTPISIHIRNFILKQLRDLNIDNTNITVDMILNVDSYVCIRHFSPNAYQFTGEEMKFVGKTSYEFPIFVYDNFPYTKDFKVLNEKCIQLMLAPNINLQAINESLKQLRNNIACNSCHREMMTISEVLAHCFHEKGNIVYCTLCMNIISSDETRRYLFLDDDLGILKHLATKHLTNKQINCSIKCQDHEDEEAFVSTFDYKFHLYYNHKTSESVIGICGNMFKSFEECETHNKIHKEKRCMECCSICNYVGEMEFEGFKHEWIHAIKKTVRCTICMEKIAVRHEFENHFNKKHVKGGVCLQCAQPVDEDHLKIHLIQEIRPKSGGTFDPNFTIML